MDLYQKRLDLYIVSHGGVSTNYLTRYLERKGVKMNEKNDGHYFEKLVHFPIKLEKDVPCLFIYGDYVQSLVSQYNRKYLFYNMNKIQLGIEDHKNRAHDFLKLFPDDPVGIKSQLKKFSLYPNTVFLRYPYSKMELQNALAKLNIFIDTSDMEIIPRKTHVDFKNIQDPLLKQICKPYHDFDFITE